MELSEPDSQGLIEAFFDSLNMRHLDRCQAVLVQLELISREQPAYVPWCNYFEGILANERDHDWAEAERVFRRLLQADLDLTLRSRVLLALGRTYGYQGRWADAIHAYEQSLLIFAELGQPVDQVKSWKQIAISYCKGFMQGDFGAKALQQAIEHCQLALDVLESITDPTLDVAWLQGSVWSTLGSIHLNLEQWDQAIMCYQQDLVICRALDDRHGIGISYLNLGEIYQKRGQDHWPQALEAYQQALNLLREFENRYLEADVLANLGFLHQEMGESESALDHYSQAISLVEGLRAGISSEEARAGFFATIVDTYANTVLLCLEAGRQAQAFDYVERARSRAFLDVLVTGSPALSREMEAETMTLAEVQAALPADALLVEYFTTGLVEAPAGRPSPGQTPERHRFPPARTLIFAITRDDFQVHDAGLSPNDLRPRQLDNVAERHFLQLKIRRALYNRLIAPVEELLPGKRRLYLVPHGPLHYIPFQALLAPDGDTLLREAGPQLIYAPSATLLFRDGRAEPSRAAARCLALGYNSEGATRLRFAEEEAQSVARLTGGQVLAGPSSKKATLYDQAVKYRLVHFSCHGNFDPASPLASALHLAPGEALTALDVLEHLCLRCDLVTLSACESGLSRVRRGDELIGLIRAFMYAGAPALVATLWRVDERSTRILMEKFYEKVHGGLGFAEALKQAQLYLKNLTLRELPVEEGNEKIFADPYYWAPFILIGDHGSA
ncbi:MAG: CHAT domain-containing protein [Anaerolineae bacterium]